MAGEQQGVGAAKAATGAGDYHDFVFEADCIAHGWAPWQAWVSVESPAAHPAPTRMRAAMNGAR
ncbi:hypothetical protein D3C86_1820160 [compost metagenome]